MRPYGGEAREEMWRVVLPCAGGACNAPLRGGAREEMWRVVLPCAGAHAMRPYGGEAREEMWRVVLPCAGAHAMRPYGAGRGRRCGVSCCRARGRMQCAPTGRGEGGDVACRVFVHVGAHCMRPFSERKTALDWRQRNGGV